MKPKFRYSVGWLLFSASMLLWLSCTKCISIRHYQTPLIQNPGFTQGLNEKGIPTGWQSTNDTSILRFTALADMVKMSANSADRSGIFQDIPVVPENYYRVDATLSDSMENSREIGVYVESITSDRRYGEWKLRKLENGEKPRLLFNSGASNSVRIFIGGPEGFNGTISLDSVNVRPVVYRTQPYTTAVGRFLYSRVKLNFDSSRFDESVQALSAYLNQIYLDSNHRADLVELQRLISHADAYLYFTGYLRQMDDVSTAYCQRISLSIGELLRNEFGMPVQQVHMNDGQTGIHQFIQYWHPFRQSWTAIDPYYGYMYKKEDSWLSAEEVSARDAAAQLFSYTTVCFDHDADELAGLWQRTQLTFDGIDRLSFPVGDQYFQ